MERVKKLKFFERFRKKKAYGEPVKTPPAEQKKSPSSPVKKTRAQKEKDLIQWK